MKTAREKAEEWLDRNIGIIDSSNVRALTILLKEQDRNTRHACAEAVIKKGNELEELGYGINVTGTAKLIHDVIMNTKAV